MTTIAAIVRYTFAQQLRNRLYLVVVLFGFVITLTSLLFGAVAGDQELPVILDVGLAATELFALVSALFGAVTLILDEVESRSLYLVLARPLSRWKYVVGRYGGLLLAISAATALMGAFHGGLLFLKGWEPECGFFLAFPCILLKAAVITALGLFFSLSSTSAPASTIFTLFFWLLGHFKGEIRFVAEKTGSVLLEGGMKAFLFVVPDLTLLGYRDLLGVPNLWEGAHLGWGALHAALYVAACLFLSSAFFARKEF
jgi:ABC-type transport system involved in multi-copper enzyme maturation permease subunit